MKIAIVKYNAGNVESVKNALRRLGIEPIVTNDADTLQSADKIIFPGVGEASTAMKFLKERSLDEAIKSLSQPVLGICLGMQLLCEFSEEQDTDCLGVLPYRVSKFQPAKLKVPQIGWNRIFNLKGRLFKGIAENSFVYFVHGFYVENSRETTANCEYGTIYSAAMERGNFYAVQFHPEKSGKIGAQILENFLNL
jgi:glutamine amidotransferase